MTTEFVPVAKGCAVYFRKSYVGVIETTKAGSVWFCSQDLRNYPPLLKLQIESDVQDQQAVMAVARRLTS